MPRLRREEWRLLGVLAVAEMFDSYDVGILSLALPEIQAGLDIPEASIGPLVAAIRLGMVVALALTVLADRAGRRRLLLTTILGFTLFTFATAFARTALEFAVLQFLARIFIAGETMLAVVVVAEELQARHRGFGIGLLGALASLGHGLAGLLFGAIDWLPYGWRALYAIGVLPLLLVAYLRRSLPETRRFEEHRRERLERGGLRASLQPLRNLARMYPSRLGLLCAAIFPFSFVIATSMTFYVKYLREVHGYEPYHVTALFLTGGALGILGNIYAGLLGDRVGRKRVMCTGMLLNAIAIVAFYNVPGGFAVALLWVVLLFTLTGVDALFRALGTELFPTSYRSTASGVRSVVSTLGGAAGLACEGLLYGVAGSHALAITWMVPVLLLPPLVIGLFLPETAARELEDVSPEIALDGRPSPTR